MLSTYAKYGGERLLQGGTRAGLDNKDVQRYARVVRGMPYCSRNVQKYQYPIMMLGGVDGERSEYPTLSSELGCLGPREEGQRRSNG